MLKHTKHPPKSATGNYGNTFNNNLSKIFTTTYLQNLANLNILPNIIAVVLLSLWLGNKTKTLNTCQESCSLFSYSIAKVLLYVFVQVFHGIFEKNEIKSGKRTRERTLTLLYIRTPLILDPPQCPSTLSMLESIIKSQFS